MLFDDLATLNIIINYGRSEMKYKEDHDPEVDRLYNSSPPILEQCMQYERARVFGNTNNSEEESLEIEAESENIVEDKAALFRRKLGPAVSMENCFRPIPLPEPVVRVDSEDSHEPRRNISALSNLLAMSVHSGNGNSNTTQLTIYLPNYESINLHVSETSNFDEILKAILDAHQSEKLYPPLHYHAPDFYAIRMHEGDGEPDMDFPAIDKTMKLKAFNLNEFCLCTADDDAMPPPPPPPAAYSISNRPVSVRAVPPSGGSFHGINPLSRKSPPPLMILESFISEKSVPVPTNPTALSRNDSFATSDTVNITIPNAGVCSVRIDECTTLGDLLPRIARTHRLRLFSDEYAFLISPEDQFRLKITSIVDLNQCVQSLGVRELELQKRVYADSAKVTVTTKEKGSAATTAKVTASTARADLEHIVYTDTSAVVYQEWNVTKKNKFGRKQERVLGVDGKKVYNSRRDKYSRSSAGVHRAQRQISSIRKVEILDNDRRTLRITWEDEREVYDIEYTCETKRDCVEIAAKILFLISPLGRKVGTSR